MNLEAIATNTVDAAIPVHSEPGPGLLQTACEACLKHELVDRAHAVEAQVPQPIHYRGLNLDVGYRLDLLIDHELIVALKTVDQLLPIQHAQLLTCQKLSNRTLGLLIHFNSPLIKNGIKRVVLNHPNAQAMASWRPGSSIV